MRDLLPEEVELRDLAMARILEVYRSHGFRRVETPALESLRLLTSVPTAAIAERLLQLTDDLCERLRRHGAKIVSDRTTCHSERNEESRAAAEILRCAQNDKGTPNDNSTPDRRSGIVAFDLPGRDPAEIRTRCRAAGVIVNCRGGHVRVSPHVYNNADDFDRLVAAMGS